MTTRDLFAIGLPALLGGSLLAWSVADARRTGLFGGMPGRFRAFHERLTGKIAGGRFLRIPGVRLVDPVRPWAMSEAVSLLALLAGGSADPTAAGVATSAVAALVLGAGVLYVSFLGAAREAIRSVRRDLPVACFLFSLLLESGMGAAAALRETSAATPEGALSRELGELVRARSLGIPRSEAVARSRERLPQEEFHLFLNHVAQGERLGIGLSGSLREMSSKMLESAGHRAETVAQQAAVKMLFPLVAFLFPAVFLLILSPVLLGLREMLWR